MTLTQQSAPYAHWDFVHPSSGDRLRIIPERGGLVSGWCCGGREILYFDQDRYADPSRSIRGGIPVLFPICGNCLLYTSPSPRDLSTSRMPSSA